MTIILGILPQHESSSCCTVSHFLVDCVLVDYIRVLDNYLSVQEGLCIWFVMPVHDWFVRVRVFVPILKSVFTRVQLAMSYPSPPQPVIPRIRILPLLFCHFALENPCPIWIGIPSIHPFTHLPLNPCPPPCIPCHPCQRNLTCVSPTLTLTFRTGAGSGLQLQS